MKQVHPLERFDHEYQQYHDLSAGRRRETLAVLRAFEAYGGAGLLHATADDLRSYLSDLIDQGQHPNTVAKKLVMVRTFVQWAFDADLIDAERLMKFKSVKRPKGAGQGLPRPYSSKEIQAFYVELDDAWPKVDPKFWQRWRRGTSRYKRIGSEVMRTQIEAVVSLALYCGLRQSEIFNLDIDDCHPDNAYVVVRQRAKVANGKDRFREVPYTQAAREAMKAWLELRDELAPGHDKIWLVGVTNVAEDVWLRPMSAKRFKELLPTIGNWQLHRFRHTCGTTWLRAGMRLELVSRLLGHSRIQQTLGYAELVKDDVQRAVEKNEAAFEKLLMGEETEDRATAVAA